MKKIEVKDYEKYLIFLEMKRLLDDGIFNVRKRFLEAIKREYPELGTKNFEVRPKFDKRVTKIIGLNIYIRERKNESI